MDPTGFSGSFLIGMCNIGSLRCPLRFQRKFSCSCSLVELIEAMLAPPQTLMFGTLAPLASPH